MSEPKHTTGNWVICTSDPRNVRKGSTSGVLIAACTVAGLPEGQTHANARLIAAAPDLLIALKHALEFLSSLPEGWLAHTTGDVGALNDFYLTGPKAIKKAEGL